MILAMGRDGALKIESITDEFVTLRQTHDVMAQLDAVVEGDMDEGYDVVDDDVNVREKGTAAEKSKANDKNLQDGEGTDKSGKKTPKKQSGKKKTTSTSPATAGKRSRGEKKSGSTPAPKRRKVTTPKGK
uniref:Uncharacterized protein n=2 Tax=Ditylum brightwellii TaxID=49249 RepID=A0A6S9ENW0_9STRA|mmetsp:Transcript_9736/g.12366  ORF Transcript_9736/g.12366 Transcript_9736/m.12366 type:complete len:130 (-) Transcript_9736:22-411(-)